MYYLFCSADNVCLCLLGLTNERINIKEKVLALPSIDVSNICSNRLKTQRNNYLNTSCVLVLLPLSLQVLQNYFMITDTSVSTKVLCNSTCTSM